MDSALGETVQLPTPAPLLMSLFCGQNEGVSVEQCGKTISSTYSAVLLRAMMSEGQKTMFVVSCNCFVGVIYQTDMTVSPLRTPALKGRVY